MTADRDADRREVAAVEALMAMSRVMTAVVARTLSKMQLSVSVPHLRLLVMLRYEGALNVKAIAGGLGVNPSNVSRSCEKLVRSGLVSRSEAALDRRNVSISLTAEGQALVDSLMAARAELLELVVASMRPADQRRLAESGDAFLTAVESSGLGELLMTRNASLPELDI